MTWLQFLRQLTLEAYHTVRFSDVNDHIKGELIVIERFVNNRKVSSVNMFDQPRQDIPLPPNVDLLSTQEVLDLVGQHQQELESYVAKFNPQEDLKTEVLRLKAELEGLQREFQQLESKRSKVQGELEECRILESQYVKKWQDLAHKIEEKYSENLLKAKLEAQMKEVESASLKLEKELKNGDDLDTFLQKYIEMRMDYHTKGEKLATWNAQGELRIK